MYNLRYHLITVVSIFLALAIGLLMGAAIGGSETLRQTSSAMVESLRADYNKAIAERDELTGRLNSQSKFTGDFIAAWAHERLFQKTVVILRDGESTSASERVDDLVKMAGGKSVIVTLARFDFKDKANAEVVKELEKRFGESDPVKLRTVVSQRLAAEWAAGGLGTASKKNPVKALINGNKSEEDLKAEEAVAQEAAQKEVEAQEAAEAASGENVQEAEAQTASAAAKPKDIDEELSSLTKFLVDKKILTVGGNTEGLAKMDALVDIAVLRDSKPDPFALEITAAALNLKIPAIVTQFSNADDDLLIEAQTRGFSGMSACDSQVGGYGVLALLTGAKGGTYGLEGMKPYPQIPTGSTFDNASSLSEKPHEAPAGPADENGENGEESGH